ncbi:FAD/NAD(P)-binding protein [Rosenbergiella nectarea]|uniref:FAD/NAD(P)-binding protein n=1 Tax=Rosenbergiella nectarea TaxID=988801 RepID=UPI001F4F77F2|nr:FAD/NAD(P)-binding protein [Rosenbergiella nectarea]
MTKRQIVIVGGGVSGTALAIQLLRRGDESLAITLIEPRADLAEGIAYSTTDPVHRINVPAARMQLSEAEKGDFDKWYRQQPAFLQDSAAQWQDGNVYPQRRCFAAYLREKLNYALKDARATFRHIQDSAQSYRTGQLVTQEGLTLLVDQLVLAISHPAPLIPSRFQAFSTDPNIISDPWQEGVLQTVDRQAKVAIIGTGLTMSDVVASLTRQGHRGTIHALSRRGQLPRTNLSGDYEDYSLRPKAILPVTVRGWLRDIRENVDIAAQQQLPWQLVLDDVRRKGQVIWQQLSTTEQRRFSRHLRPWWDVHRYRLAPQVAAVVDDLLATGQLQINAARLLSVRGVSEQLELTLGLRQGGLTKLLVDKVILTTGPAHQQLIASQPLLTSLQSQGLITADPLGLGIAVNPQSQTLSPTGVTQPNLFVVGPAARGRFGELMGLPQVAEHAEFIAKQLIAAQPSSLKERCPSHLN